MADLESEQPRVKSAKIYGKRRPDSSLNLESSGVASINTSSGSPVLGSSTGPGDSEPGTSTEINYQWKALLNRIDEGKEDENLEFGIPLDLLSFPKSPASKILIANTPTTEDPLPVPDEEPSSTVHTQESTPPAFSEPNHDSETTAIALELTHAFSNDGHSSEDSGLESSSGRKKSVKKSRLTKKERVAMEKETARVKAARSATLINPQSTWVPVRRPMTAWVAHSTIGTSESDAIEAFTSSPSSKSEQHSMISIEGSIPSQSKNYRSSVPEQQASRSRVRPPSPTKNSSKSPNFAGLETALLNASGSESDNPSADELIAKSDRKAVEKKNIESARKLKLEAVKNTNVSLKLLGDDDDLEVEPPPGTPISKTTNSTLSTRRQQLTADSVKRTIRVPSNAQPTKKQGDLFGTLLAKFQTASAKIRAAKEEDWVARGGQLVDTRKGSGRHITGVLAQTSQMADHDGPSPDLGSEDDEQDEDYQPDEADDPANLETSADVEQSSNARNAGSSQKNPLSLSTSSSHPSIVSNFLDDTDGDEGAVAPSPATSVSDGEVSPTLKTRKGRLRRAIVSDDDEEERNMDRPSSGGSIRLMDSDAENQLPSANSSDAENAAPPKIERVSSGLPTEVETRGPLQPLASFPSLSSLPSPSKIPRGRKRSGSDVLSSSSSQTQPLAERSLLRRDTADSQFGDNDFGFGGMSQLFSPSQKSSLTQQNKFRDNTLVLGTQTSGLLPAVHISDTQKKRNDELLMRQEEDNLLLARSPGTRPGMSGPGSNQNRSPDALALPWTQLSPGNQDSGGSQKFFVEGLEPSMNTSLVLSPSTPTKRARVVRGRENVSPSPSPASLLRSSHRSPSAASLMPRNEPRNAFQLMMAAKPRKTPVVNKEEVDRFYEGEAVESDEETPFGLDAHVQDNEEDEEADGDEVAKDLVDDQEMDETTQAKGLVFEKHQELEKVDDEKNLKIARDAVEGKFRTGTKRRRRGIDGVASDGDTSDEEGLRRAKPPKKRNIVGDTLPALAKDPATLPFFQAYQSGIAAEDNDVLMPPKEDSEEGESEDEEGGASQTYIGASEVRERLRNKEYLNNPNLIKDPSDVSWIVEEEDSQMYDDDGDDDVTFVTKPSVMTLNNGDIDQELHLSLHRESETLEPQEETEQAPTWSGPRQMQSSSRGPKGGHFAPKNPRPSTFSNAATTKRASAGTGSNATSSRGLRKTESVLKAPLFKKGSGFE